jgi:hypothetical protein
MHDDLAVNQSTEPIEVSQPTPASPNSEKAALLRKVVLFIKRIGITWLLLIGFSLLVIVAIYLGRRQPPPNSAKPSRLLKN